MKITESDLKTFEGIQTQFTNALSKSVAISANAIGINHTGRQNRALFIFAKLIAHCMAISALMEKHNYAPQGAKLLDHFSIAALGRTVIDASLMVMYISEPKLTRAEWDLRRQILFLHDLSNRNRFLKSVAKIKTENDSDFLQSYDVVKPKIIEKIQSLSIGLGHSYTEIEEFCSGQRVYVQGAQGAAREAGWNVDLFAFMQSYLSNWVHSHPVSFMRADEHKISFSNPSEYQKGQVCLVLDVCTECLNDTNARMAKFSGNISKDPVGQLD